MLTRPKGVVLTAYQQAPYNTSPTSRDQDKGEERAHLGQP